MRTRQAMLELKEALHLPVLPRRIEGYDISNTQGILSVASMVVFQDGLPDKKAYRIYRIKTVEGANDFASHGRGDHPPLHPWAEGAPTSASRRAWTRMRAAFPSCRT